MDRGGYGGGTTNASGFTDMTPMGRDYGMNGAVARPRVPLFDTWTGTPYAGRFASRGAGGDGGPTPTEMVGTPYRGIGKTNVGLPSTGPPLSAQTPFQGLAPKVGVAEALIGGLVEQFTGALPGFARDPLVGVAHGIGQVLDVPLELAGHVPLPWVPDVQEAFDRLPVTAQTQQIKQLALSDPDTALRYMSQYLRMHEQEYMEALAMPRMLSPLMMPDSNILERGLGILGLPQQFIARQFAGSGLRNIDDTILNAPANSLPQPLEEVRARRLSGDLTQDQFVDEVTQLGYAFTNDAFANFFLSIATDPIIVGSMGSGAALGAMERGSLALRTARGIGLLRKEAPELVANAEAQAIARTANDITTHSPLTPLETATEQATNLAKEAADIGTAPRGRAGAFNDLVRRNIEGLQPGAMTDALRRAEDTLSRRQRAVVRAEPIVRAVGNVAHHLNEPFRVFGTDRAADMVGALRSDAHSRGVFNAYGYGNLRAIAKATGVSTQRLVQSASWWMANSEMSLVHRNSMVKLIKSSGRIPEHFEDATPNARIREVSLMANDVLVNESQRHAARAMPSYVLDTSDIADPKQAARLRSEYRAQQETIAASRLVYATGMTIEEATKLVKGGSDKRLALAEGLAYGRSIGDMLDARTLDAKGVEAAIAKATEAGDTKEVARLTGLRDVINRYTLLGARELSLEGAKELLRQIDSGDPQAANIARRAIDQYDVLNQNFERMFDEDGRLVEDAVLIDRLSTWLRDNISGGENGHAAFPTELKYADLPTNLKSFIDQSRQVNGGEEFAYRLAVAPAAEDMWRVTKDTTGRLVGVNPWVEVSSAQAPIFMPSNWDRMRNTLFGPVRGEKLLYEARARFIREATAKHNLSRRDSINLFEAVRKTASERNIQPRGLSIQEFEGVVDGVAKGVSPQLAQKLGGDGLALLTARAFEGEAMTVGVTSKLTGKMKTRTAGSGNWVGVVAEKLYPMMRFSHNVIFQMQEWLEPYFFNIIRGVKPALQWTPEDRAVLAMLDRWKLGTMFNDQAEYAYVSAQGWASTHRPETTFGPSGQIAIVNEKRMSIRNVRDRKMLNYIRDVKADGGQQWKRYMLNSAPEVYAKLESEYGTTDAGSIAVRFWIEKGLHHAEDQHYQSFLATGYIPHTIGKPHAVSMPILSKTLGYRDAIALRKAIKDGGLTEAQFRAHPVVGTFDKDFLDRSWATAVFESPDEWFDTYAKHMKTAGRTNKVIDLSIRVMRGMAEAAAGVKGISLDEYLATRFAGKPVWVDSQRELPRQMLAQTMSLMREDIRRARESYAGPLAPTDAASPTYNAAMQRAYALLGGPTGTPEQMAKAARLANERAALGEGVPLGREGVIDVGTENFPFGTTDPSALLDSLNTTVQETGVYPGSFEDELIQMYLTISELLDGGDLDTLLNQNIAAHPRVGMLDVAEGFVEQWDPAAGGVLPGIRGSDWASLVDDMRLYGHEPGGNGAFYHTTTASPPVTEQGLRTRAQVGRQGLGGGPDDMVSITYDPDHADMIRDRTKVFVRAARGEITADEVWAHFFEDMRWEHLWMDPSRALTALGIDSRAPHWKTDTPAEWAKAKRYFAREWDAQAGDRRGQWARIQRADRAAHGWQQRANNINLQPGDREPLGGIIVVDSGHIDPFTSHAAIDPEDVRTVQVAVRPGSKRAEVLFSEHEIRLAPEDIQTLGDVDAASSRIQGTMRDMRSEVAARMIAGYASALEDGISPGSIVQQTADVLNEITRAQKADPKGAVGAQVASIPLVRELVGNWAPGAKGVASPYGRDLMNQTLTPSEGRTAQVLRGQRQAGFDRTAAAIDIHAKRALGYMDPEYARVVARRMVKADVAVDEQAALAMLSEELGFDVTKPRTLDASDAEIEYARASQTANEMADRANYEQWQGRDDWTAGDMATLLSTHARRMAEQHQDGGTMLREHFVTEVSPGYRRTPEWTNPMPTDELTFQPGSTIESTLPEWDRLTDQQMSDVSRQVAVAVQQFVEEATGVRFVGIPIDVAVPRGGGAAAVSPATGWSMMHLSDEAVDNAMDMIGHHLQLDEVWGTKYSDALTSDSSKGIHWAMDLRLPSTASPRHWDAFMRYVAEAYPTATRLLSARDTEGRQVVRVVWQSEGTATLDDFLREVTEAEPGIADELYVGDWVSGLPEEFDWMADTVLPVESDRHTVQVKVASNRADGYPAEGSTFEYQRGLAKDRAQREGISAQEATDAEIGRTYLDRIRARGPDGAALADSMVRVTRDQTKQLIDDAFEVHTGDLLGPVVGGNRLASLGGGARGTTTQYQRAPRGVRGAVAYEAGGRATLYVTKHVDASTGVHEMAHIFARDLDESGKQAIMTAYEAQPARAGKRKWKNWNSHHEEYLARQFESYVAGGSKLAPTSGLKSIFNAFGEWGRRNLEGGVKEVPGEVKGVFDRWFDEADQSEPKATFDADEYRYLNAMMQFFTRGEEAAHTRNYYARGRSWTERSVNHPYLGMYPASYMWGKVLPAMIRFLVAKPFGVDAPFAGLAMAKHVSFYTQLLIQTNPEIADFIEDHPESVRLFALMLPGTPWDIPVNVPAWARHAAEDANQNKLREQQGLKPQPTDFGRIIEDTINYAFGAGRSVTQPLDVLSEWNGPAPEKDPDDAAAVWSRIGL